MLAGRGGGPLESCASIMTGVFQRVIWTSMEHLDLSFFKKQKTKTLIYILSVHLGVGGVATEEANQGDCWGAMFLSDTSGTPLKGVPIPVLVAFHLRFFP